MPLLADIAVPHLDAAEIVIDGVADEAAWEDALVIGDFRTWYPDYGLEPDAPTEVRLLSDPRALYVHVRAYDPDPELVRAFLSRRDSAWSSDHVYFYLDTSGDGTRAYFFGVSASGVKMDGVRVAGSGTDMSWDARWGAEARLTQEGYEVEIRIPWRAVRHPQRSDYLGLMFFRAVARGAHESCWPPLDPATNGLLVQEAVVAGPGRLPPSAGLDIVGELPFTMGTSDEEDPRLGLGGFHPGITARYVPQPATSVLATFNPDFSEVESDGFRIEANRRYPIFFSERRPFFLEGAEWFDHPRGELLYTRSVVTPLYGVRATAEHGPWAAAALHALDASPAGSKAELGGWSDDDVAEHQALATVARLRHDVGQDGYIGLIASDRTVLGTGLYNRLGGPDVRFRLSKTTTVEGAALLSDTAMADRVTGVVPTATGSFAYAGDRPFGGFDLAYTDPDFRAENGWLLVTDRVGGSAYAGMEFRPGWAWVPYFRVQPVRPWMSWSTDGELQSRGAQVSARAGLGNGGGMNLYLQRSGDLYAGEWLERDFGGGGLWADWTRWLAAGVGVSTGEGAWYDDDAPAVGWESAAWGWLTLRPTDRIALRQSVTWQSFDLEGGNAYNAVVGRTRADLFFSRALWFRAIWDGSAEEDEQDRSVGRGGEALLAWEREPGSAVFLGGRLSLPGPGSDEPMEWIVTAKASFVVSM